jgi:hypothetical protein
MVLGTAPNKTNISISEGVFPNGEVLESQFKLKHAFPPFVLQNRCSNICNSHARLPPPG